MTRNKLLPILALAYCAASLFHFAHNAEYIDEYPNLPAWLSSPQVYGAWLGVASVGLVGYLLMRYGFQRAGLAFLGVYGALGLDGFAHYTLAPSSAHTLTMNLSIWLEALTGVLLLAAALTLMLRRARI